MAIELAAIGRQVVALANYIMTNFSEIVKTTSAQCLLNRTHVFAFEMLLSHILLRGSAQNLCYSLADESLTESVLIV